MKKIIGLITFLLLIPSISSCNNEDGNINDWVGEYSWILNREEKWHSFITGEKKKQSEESYWPQEFKYHLKINEDKTWFQLNSDKISTSGYSGKVRCYKDHICFVDMPSNYHISDKFQFKFVEENKSKLLKYYYDESVDKHGLDYDYTIRYITLGFQ